MKVCVIGGTGHTGKNIVRMLAREDFEVSVVSRGIKPIFDDSRISFIKKDYDSSNEQWHDLFSQIKPDVIIDILGSFAPVVYETGKIYCKHFILCGSIWMFGEAKIVPTPEITQASCIFPGYAKRYSDMLKLKEKAKADGIRFTAIMPPNICGPGKIPLDCYGSRGIENHKNHMAGKPVPLPEPGQTLIGPCDAEDVARGFYLSVMNPEMASDEIFNVGSAYALTAKQFVETYAQIYRTKIPIDWCSWKEYSEEINPQTGANFHFKAHMCPDISKIAKKLAYKPAYAPEETMERAVSWMKQQGLI
ncbi:MAG: NAD(P)-dependent oxidoreductase [Candidatus Omnitrophica bacterium]|nr:NAD(P)-dependent oxidoreductase [Candidatus Omnitrophota bacterium]MCM8825351.1 NAD(P)-dependent oxidoreductase [Candidatus Omnitrophota bacterium]MCM8828824.1 NAD(P)-dependent oxidoreductase [Candidatus Omnitrophota bacterium]